MMTKLTYRYEAQRDSGRVRCFLGFVVMFQSYDDISFFMSFVNIPVSLDNLFQRIASIYDWF